MTKPNLYRAVFHVINKDTGIKLLSFCAGTFPTVRRVEKLRKSFMDSNPKLAFIIEVHELENIEKLEYAQP